MSPKTLPKQRNLPPVTSRFGSIPRSSWCGSPHLHMCSSGTAACLTWACACEHVAEAEAAACARLGSERVAPGTTKLLTLFTQSITVTTSTAAGRKHRPPRCLAMLPAASLLRNCAVCSMLPTAGRTQDHERLGIVPNPVKITPLKTLETAQTHRNFQFSLLVARPHDCIDIVRCSYERYRCVFATYVGHNQEG